MRPILLSLLICTFFTGFSQKKSFEYKPDFKMPKSGYLTITATGVSGKTVLGITNQKEIIYLLLSKDLSIEDEFSPAQGLKNSYYDYDLMTSRELGSIFNEKTNKGYLVYGITQKKVMKGREQFKLDIIDFQNKKIEQQVFFEPQEYEQPVTNFEYQGKFYFISCLDNSLELIVRILDENGNTIKKNYSLSNLKDRIISGLSEFLNSPQSFVASDSYKDPEDVYRVKAFIDDQKIFFTYGAHEGIPKLLTLDLETGKTVFKDINLIDLCTSVAGKKSKTNDNYSNNCYYSNKKLYILNVCKEKTQLFIYNVANSSIEKKIEFAENSSDYLAQTPIVYKTSGGKSEDPKPLTDTKNLYEYLATGSPNIEITQNDRGHTQVSFGMYSKGGYEILGGFTRRINSAGNVVALDHNDGSSVVIKTVIICKIVLDANNNPIKIQSPSSEYIQTQDYCNKSIPSTFRDKYWYYTIRHNNKLHVIYFDTKSTLHLEEIPIKY